ncbi:MAG: alpha/beta fold hydrolase [Thermoleophilaceae bacterium]|nr:alpha/beta fold hydrolase [Thermoleophilaceae bacterium]
MVPLAHDRAGTGPPLVLIHPLGAHRGVWKPVLGLLGEHHDVIAVDMPGFGGSPQLPADVPATAVNIAAAVRSTLASLGVERAHAAGISLGGWVALELGKTDMALSVTTLCTAGFWRNVLGPRPEVARSTARRLLPVLRPLLHSAKGRRVALAGAMAHPERVPPADAYELVRAYARAEGFTRANHEMRSALFTGFDDIDVPVTMAWADRDRSVYPPEAVPPGVEVRRLRDCGHVPTWDSPEQVAAVIRDGARRAVPASA